MRKFALIFLTLACSSHPLLVQADLLPFDSQTLEAVEKRYEGKPFLLSIWSVDCAPCRIELQLLASMKKRFASFNLILVSADHFDDKAEIKSILSENQLDGIDTWVFSDKYEEKLRYSIDSEWSGELPRSYLYDAHGSRKTIKGLMSEGLITSWLNMGKMGPE